MTYQYETKRFKRWKLFNQAIKVISIFISAVILFVMFLGWAFSQAEVEQEWRKDRLCSTHHICGEK